MWRLRGVTWRRFLSIVYAWKLAGEQDNTRSGIIPLLCTLERPDRAVPSKLEFSLIFPSPRGDMGDLMQFQTGRSAWSGQLTERWLATQCCQLAASLSAIHRIAALKIPKLPRLRFFRTGRLAVDVVKWLSSSETDLGTLVFSNFSTEPPTPDEAAPEYFFNLNRPKERRKGSRRDSRMSRRSYESDRWSTNDGRAEEGELEMQEYSVPAHPSSRVRYTHEDRPREAQKVGSQGITPAKSGSKSSARTSKFQVWCLGTVWLQLVTCFLLGPQGRGEFEHIFTAQDRRSGFLETVHNIEHREDRFNLFNLNNDVRRLMHRLEGHGDSTPFIRELLRVIEFRMLEVNADSRAPSLEIMSTLEELERRTAKVAAQ